jgi:DNA-cytosine methyltransferase
MNVLSLFDGMACARIALERAGFQVKKYYASEIDSHAIKVSSTKYPDIIHLGDVTKVNTEELGRIDILMGGSPCQGFSFAGKQLNFKDPRSALFFEFVRILKEVRKTNPDVLFLLENVDMKQEHQNVISKILGVNPIIINSTLVSAQNRVRLYWTNINMVQVDFFGHMAPQISQPKDRKIFLKDILLDEVHEKYYLSEKALKRIIRKVGFKPQINPEKTGTLNTNNNSSKLNFDHGTTLISGALNQDGVLSEVVKSNYIDANYWIVTHNLQQRSGVGQGGKGPFNKKDGKSYCLDTINAQAIEVVPVNAVIQVNESVESNGLQPYMQNRVYDPVGKSPSLLAELSGRLNSVVNNRIRRLTPIECCRLQTVPDDYFYHDGKPIVSETNMYKMLGNGWTIDVIVHFLNHIKR